MNLFVFPIGSDILLVNGACPQQLIVWWSIDDGVMEDWRHNKEFIYPIIDHSSITPLCYSFIVIALLQHRVIVIMPITILIAPSCLRSKGNGAIVRTTRYVAIPRFLTFWYHFLHYKIELWFSLVLHIYLCCVPSHIILLFEIYRYYTQIHNYETKMVD